MSKSSTSILGPLYQKYATNGVLSKDQFAKLLRDCPSLISDSVMDKKMISVYDKLLKTKPMEKQEFTLQDFVKASIVLAKLRYPNANSSEDGLNQLITEQFNQFSKVFSPNTSARYLTQRALAGAPSDGYSSVRPVSMKKQVEEEEEDESANMSSALYDDEFAHSTEFASVPLLLSEDAERGMDAEERGAGLSRRASPSPRLEYIDIARGITVVLMLMVDNQGSFAENVPLWIFQESDWQGLGPADCVFATFLFVMGMSISIAMKKYSFDERRKKNEHVGVEEGLKWYDFPANLIGKKHPLTVWWHILMRSIKLFAVGALLNLWACNFHVEKWVYLGVLQRIAICYFVIANLNLLTPGFLHRLIVIGCVAAYMGVMYGIQVPPERECPRGSFTLQCNAASYVDRTLLGTNHVFADGTLPEGLVSSLTSVFTTALGYEVGKIAMAQDGSARKVMLLYLVQGGFFAFLGWIASMAQPIVKKIWTIPFVCCAAAFSMGVLLVAKALTEVGKCGSSAGRGSGRRTRCRNVCIDLLEVLPFGGWFPDAWICGKEEGGDGEAGPAGGYGEAGADSGMREALLGPEESGKGGGEGGGDASSAPASCFARIWQAILAPFKWLGINAFAVFTGMVALEILLLDTIQVSCLEKGCTGNISAWTYTYEAWALKAVGEDNQTLASTLVALAHMLLWIAVAGAMYQCKVVVRL
jgi:predicted acyltransferase